jgi:ABC transport system ATP-binding/permease protein
VEEYLRRRARLAADVPGAAATALAARPTPAAAQRAARKELQRLERQLTWIGDQETRLTASLAAEASDYARLIELGAELRTVQDEKARLEEQWLTVADDLPS